MKSAPTSLEPRKGVDRAWLLGLAVMTLVVASSGAHASAESAARSRPPLDAPAGPPRVTQRMETANAALRVVPPLVSSATRTVLSPSEERSIVDRARLEIERVAVYDSSWMLTSSYPMGDIPQNRGACTDVVVRSLREIGIDLQELVHDDLASDLRAYGVAKPDTHIDHRRLPTMFTFFRRNTMTLTTSLKDPSAWRPGDIVFVGWRRRGAPAEHVGIISDRVGPRGLPLVIENAGPKVVEQDSLGSARILGHFRALEKE